MGHAVGENVTLRYVLTDGRIEMCWPCRVVEDSDTLVVLFIAAGSNYKAGPKRTAAAKRASPSPPLPPNEYLWRRDVLRLMLPGRQHSVWLFWEEDDGGRRFSRYFVNMEEPYRRTAIGFDTQDHTLDINVFPDLTWSWRDEGELENHVTEGFFTRELAESIRSEAAKVIDEISRNSHPCLAGWSKWSPDPAWEIPRVSDRWATTPATFWSDRSWAYGLPD
jgi:Protein of unknown function (DUF402)